MWTVSWQPGALRGYSVEQTSQMIVRGLQMWMGLTGIKFGTVPHGTPAHIKIYPYAGNMNGAYMATYMSTRQIIYTTLVNADREFNIMAFSHEIGHALGLGHVNRPGALMYTRGSVDRYFDHIEAQQEWRRFGKFSGLHWPWSLAYLGNQIRELKVVAEHAKKRHAEFAAKREAERDIPKRKAYDKTTREWLAKKRAAYVELKRVSDRWLTIKRDWDNIGGIRQNIQAPALQSIEFPKVHLETHDMVCDCFHQSQGTSGISFIQDKVDLKSVFKSLGELS